jgi:methylmalonyl-CoA mutase N-terminal domain/subunit
VVVGVNRFGDGGDPPVIPAPDFSALERSQVASLAEVRRRRDGAAVERALAALREAARPYADPARRAAS